MEKYDVVVIGAGLAGLSCALELTDHKSDLSILVLEARDRVGGRTCSEINPLGSSSDVGGAYLGPGQERALGLIERFGLSKSLYKVHHEGKSVMMNGSERTTYVGDIPNLRVASLIELNSLLVQVHDLADTICTEKPWESPKAEYWDHISVGQWVKDQTWTKDACNTFLSAFTSLFCVEPSESSMLFFLWTCKNGDNISRLIAVDNGAQEQKLGVGTMQISVEISKFLQSREKCSVQLNSPVRRIDSSDPSNIIITYESQNSQKTISCKKLVSAIPPNLYTSIIWTPNLPTAKVQLSQRMPMGCIIKTVTYYSKAWWREKGLSGEIVNVNVYPVVYCVDDTKPDGKYPALMGFVVANASRKLQDKTKEERMKILADYYAKALQIDEFPIAYHEKKWNEEVFTGGCYSGVCVPGVMTTVFPALRSSIADGRILFCGTETATQYANYMDGAIQSGQRAASEILQIPFNQIAKTTGLIPSTPIGPSKLERQIPSLLSFIKLSVLLLAIIIYYFFF